MRGVDDSKKLTPAERERLARIIRRRALAIGLGGASAREVDTINVYHATVLAMRRALRQLERRLGAAPDHVLVDGKPLRTLGVEHTAVVKGDALCHAVACASIVAKVTRDRVMRRMDALFPHYGFSSHVGYITPSHSARVRISRPSTRTWSGCCLRRDSARRIASTVAW